MATRRSYFLPATRAILDRIVLLQLNLRPDADCGIGVRWMIVLAIDPAHAAWSHATAFDIGLERFLLIVGGSMWWWSRDTGGSSLDGRLRHPST